MKKKLFSAFLCAAACSSMAQSPSLQWARQMGGSDYDSGNYVAVDGSGNVYTTGYFAGIADFDPGPGTATLSCSGAYNAFVTKFDAAGNFIWARNIADSDDEAYAQTIKTDAAGNIYIGGICRGTTDFDPGAATNTVTAAGLNDLFISKLDASGNLLWARAFGGTDNDGIGGICLDASNNVYTAGYFAATVDFDPGPATHTLTAAGSDIFVLKLSPAGNFAWVSQMQGTGYNTTTYITGSSSGKIYLSGNFEQSVDFDPGASTYSLSSVGSYDAFVMQLDAASGVFGWAGQIGAAGEDVYIYALETDAAGNLYTAGNFSGTMDLDPGAGVRNETSAGNADVFVSKLGSGGALAWEKVFGGTGDDYAYGIALDASNGIYLTGAFQDTPDFDPGAASYTVTAEGAYDMFINKLDGSGNFAWATTYGGAFSDVYGYAVQLDASSNIIATGSFNYVEDFDPSAAGTYTLSSVGYTDAFTMKLGQCTAPAAPVITSTATAALTLCAGNMASLTATGTGTVSWYASPTATTVLGTGTAYTTPTLSAGSYTYYASAKTCTTSPRASVTVTVNTCTGIQSLDAAAEISLYPNPASDRLYIHTGAYGNCIASIYDLLGNLVAEQPLSQGLNSIDLGTKAGGVYLVKVCDAQRRQLLVKRIIKE